MKAGDSKLDYWRERYQRMKKEREALLPPDPLETLSETEAAYSRSATIALIRRPAKGGSNSQCHNADGCLNQTDGKPKRAE